MKKDLFSKPNSKGLSESIINKPTRYHVDASLTVMNKLEAGKFNTKEQKYIKRIALQIGTYIKNALMFSEVVEKNQQLIDLQDEIIRKNVEKAQLEQRELHNRELSNGIIHEVKNSYFAVKGFVDMLLNQDDENQLSAESQREVLMAIGEQATRLHLFSKNYLQGQVYATGAIKLMGATVSLYDAVQDGLLANKYYLLSKSAQVETNVEAHLQGVGWDREQIHLLISNLINNAASHAGESPIISIQGWLKEGVVECVVNSYDLKKSVVLTQSDVDSMVKNASGQGIRICSYIVGAHGGTLSRFLNDEGGLRSVVQLPAEIKSS